jgi:hypothetical protein
MRLHQSQHLDERPGCPCRLGYHPPINCAGKTVDVAAGVQQVIILCIDRLAASIIFIPVTLACDINQLGIACHSDNTWPPDHPEYSLYSSVSYNHNRALARLCMARQKAIQVVCKGLAISLIKGRRATGINTTGTQCIHKIAHIQARPYVVR